MKCKVFSIFSHCETDFSGWSPLGRQVRAARAQVQTGLLTRRLQMTLKTRLSSDERVLQSQASKKKKMSSSSVSDR